MRRCAPPSPSRGWNDIVASPFARDDGSSGALLVANRLGEVSTFDTEDMKVLETFARHTAIALRVGDLVDRLRAEAAEKEFSALHDSLTGLANRKLLVPASRSCCWPTPTRRCSACSSWTSTGSRKSTTPSATTPATACSSRSAAACSRVIGRRGLIARLGGDEFGLVLARPRPRVDEALALARTIEKEIDTPFVIDQLSLEVQVSIGVALAPLEARRIRRSCSNTPTSPCTRRRTAAAASSCTTARATTPAPGASAWPATCARRIDERTALPRLPAAGEPGHAAHRRRWRRSPAGATRCFGPVSPDEFISLAEQSGMVHTLTRWAIKSSLEELVRWRRCDPDLRVSVNVSARNLIDVSLRRRRRATSSREVGLPGEALTLEITESRP